MSLSSRAVQRLRYLYSCVLRKEHLHNTTQWQVWSALRSPQMEALEPRLLLDGADLVGPLAAETSPISADTINVDDLWPGTDVPNPATDKPYSLAGQRITLGVWDVGDVFVDHQEFWTGLLDPSSRVLNKDGQTFIGDHATHVAGTMVAFGIDEDAKGMAPEALLYAFDAVDPATGDILLSKIMTDLADNADDIFASNHSYGPIAGFVPNPDGTANEYAWTGNPGDYEDPLFGKYGDQAGAMDAFLANYPQHTAVVAAGNSRFSYDSSLALGDAIEAGETFYNGLDYANPLTFSNQHSAQDGFDTLPGGMEIAKNAITVGAIYGAPDNPYNLAAIHTTYESSWGPTDDGRIKPDLVADGYDVYGAGNQSETNYFTAHGTSEAAPAVTGAIGVLGQLWQDTYGYLPTSDVVKAVLIHTATDLGTSGPDFQSGWGLVNARAAADVVAGSSVDGYGAHILQGTYTGDSVDYNLVVGNMTSELKVTLVWIDPAAAENTAGVDDPTRALVHDMDLTVEREDGVFSRPWVMARDQGATDPATPARGNGIRAKHRRQRGAGRRGHAHCRRLHHPHFHGQSGSRLHAELRSRRHRGRHSHAGNRGPHRRCDPPGCETRRRERVLSTHGRRTDAVGQHGRQRGQRHAAPPDDRLERRPRASQGRQYGRREAVLGGRNHRVRNTHRDDRPNVSPARHGQRLCL